VIENGSSPRGRAVANGAILREARCSVIRIRGALILRLVTGITGGTQAGELPAGMALSALQRGVSAREREPGATVVECRAAPTRCGVAHRAIVWEAGRGVIRISGALILRLVTGVTIGRQAGEIVVHVARGTLHCGVRAG
jgi:hypothetical protein